MRTITPEDYRRLESLSSLAGSPDGACAYTVYFWQEDSYHRRVELVMPGQKPEVITCQGKCETDPAFSADGKKLYFLSDGNVYVYDRETGESRICFAPQDGFAAYGFAVMPQGLAVKIRREIREEAPEGCDWEMPLVAENLRYRNDADHGFTKIYERKLLLVTDETLVLGEGRADWQYLACADENTLLFGQGGWQTFDIQTREKTCLDENLIPAAVPAVHGQQMIAAARSKQDYSLGLYRFDLAHTGGKPVELAFDLPTADGAYCDKSPEKKTQLCFRADGKALAILTNQAVPGLWNIDEGKKLSEETIFECAAAGETLWVVRGGNARSMEICTLENGECIPQACHNAWLGECAVPSCQTIDVPSIDGKATLHGFYMLPENPENAPVLLWIHGGPEGFYTDGLWMEMKAAVARGFAVVMPNPRGSSGYGNAYQHSGQEFDQGACVDVLTILDAVLRAHPQLDPNRLGVLGGSYGGYLSAMLAGGTKRFKAAVVIKPVTNWLFIHFNSSQSGQDVFAEHRDFQDFLCDMIRMSPISLAGNVEIPTLIIHGEKDQQCPVDNAHQFYVAVRDTHPDLPVRLIVMPDCCHGYSRDHVNDYIYIQNQTLDWLEKYV